MPRVKSPAISVLENERLPFPLKLIVDFDPFVSSKWHLDLLALRLQYLLLPQCPLPLNANHPSCELSPGLVSGVRR